MSHRKAKSQSKASSRRNRSVVPANKNVTSQKKLFQDFTSRILERVEDASKKKIGTLTFLQVVFGLFGVAIAIVSIGISIHLTRNAPAKSPAESGITSSQSADKSGNTENWKKYEIFGGASIRLPPGWQIRDADIIASHLNKLNAEKHEPEIDQALEKLKSSTADTVFFAQDMSQGEGWDRPALAVNSYWADAETAAKFNSDYLKLLEPLEKLGSGYKLLKLSGGNTLKHVEISPSMKTAGKPTLVTTYYFFDRTRMWGLMFSLPIEDEESANDHLPSIVADTFRMPQ